MSSNSFCACSHSLQANCLSALQKAVNEVKRTQTFSWPHQNKWRPVLRREDTDAICGENKLWIFLRFFHQGDGHKIINVHYHSHWLAVCFFVRKLAFLLLTHTFFFLFVLGRFAIRMAASQQKCPFIPVTFWWREPFRLVQFHLFCGKTGDFWSCSLLQWQRKRVN